MCEHWTADDVPDQRSRVAVITGANAGLGLATAAGLAGKGAHVVLAVRNLYKGRSVASTGVRGSVLVALGQCKWQLDGEFAIDPTSPAGAHRFIPPGELARIGRYEFELLGTRER
jgi:NAD(P)-dependent dehydrogenase (short-subunit alcohol dehydrogenase family)